MKRCKYYDLKLGRCLRPWNHTGVHYFPPIDLMNEYPILYDALCDKRTILYFNKKLLLSVESLKKDGQIN